MPGPICDGCSKATLLCRLCQKKLDGGLICPADVCIAQTLAQNNLDVGFLRAIDTENEIIVVAPQENVGDLIGVSGATLKLLSKSCDMNVKIVGAGDLKETSKALIAPAKLLRINSIHGADGEKLKVYISKTDTSRLRMQKTDLETVIGSITGQKAEIVFE